WGLQMLEMQEKNGAVIVGVRVQPRASRDEIAGEWEGALRVRLQAPPVDDRANEALIELLARILKISRSAVRILSGERSAQNRVRLARGPAGRNAILRGAGRAAEKFEQTAGAGKESGDAVFAKERNSVCFDGRRRNDRAGARSRREGCKLGRPRAEVRGGVERGATGIASRRGTRDRPHRPRGI